MTLAYDSPSTGVHDYEYLRERIDALRNQHDSLDRRRIRAIMNGGAAGVQAVLAWDEKGPTGSTEGLGVDLPTANLMHSGLERLAQKIGKAPTLKTSSVPTRDTSVARKRAEKRHRIVTAWDELNRLELHFPQMGRWLPGYGFTLHTISEDRFGDTIYPVARMRDPYDVYPGFWGPDQQPTEVAIIRRLPYREIQRAYPWAKQWAGRPSRTGVVILGSGGWESNGGNTDVELAEYIDESGTYVVCRDTEEVLDFIPNPLSSGPAFVMTKRFSFDALQGQYTHVVGLMSMMAKLNLLGLIAAEDSVFRETNVYGEMDSLEYEKGRDAINFFQMGTRVEKPTGEQVNQTWQAINILERQFRIGGAYDVSQDGISPNSFATGEGIKQLQSSEGHNVREYQTSIKHSIELIDRKRLEWDEVMHPNLKRKVFWYEGSKQNEEEYTAAADIAGDYRTQRVYGAMATFDETSKILAGLQLHGARIIDTRTLQENLDGLAGEVSLINERLVEDMARDALIAALGNRSAQMDPIADDALVKILANPKDAHKILSELFVAKEEQGGAPMGVQEMLGGAAPAGGPGQQVPVQTILAQMEAEGGGAQTVAVNS